MSRADAARSEQDHEIPYAQRTRPINRLSSRKIRYLLFPSIFFSFLLSVFAYNLIFESKTKNVLTVNRVNDSSLLGHLPYPEAKANDLVELYPGLKVHKDIFDDLLNMKEAAYRDGVHLVFLSGFRGHSLQNEIFYSNKSSRNQIAVERAKVSAPSGYSEHSTGYAIDIGDRSMRETDFEVEFESTPAFRWLQKNAPKYHFVLSFPPKNSQKISYEPWHWRYEGTVEALKLFERANRIRIQQESLE